MVVWSSTSKKADLLAIASMARSRAVGTIVVMATAARAYSDKRRSWREAPLLFGPLAALTVLSWVGTASSAVLLLSSPLYLVAMSPRLAFLVVAATNSTPAAFVLVATLRLCIADPLNYRIGRIYGAATLSWASRRFRVIRRFAQLADRWMQSFGLVVVALRPNGSTLMLAGSSNLGFRRTMLAAFVGTLAYVGVIYMSASIATASASAAVATVGSWSLRLKLSVVAGAAVAALATVLLLQCRRRQIRTSSRPTAAVPADPVHVRPVQPGERESETAHTIRVG